MTSSRLPPRPPTPDDELPQPARWNYQAQNMRLASLSDYQREMNSLYRLARGNQLKLTDLTRLIYALRQASDLAREIEELEQLRSLNQQLQQLRAHDGPNTYVSVLPQGGTAIDGDLLPAQEEPT